MVLLVSRNTYPVAVPHMTRDISLSLKEHHLELAPTSATVRMHLISAMKLDLDVRPPDSRFR